MSRFALVAIPVLLVACHVSDAKFHGGECTTACQLGEKRCNGDTVETCDVGADQCTTWTSTTTCSGAMPFCSNGACSDQCSDECPTAGATRCDGAGEQTCGQFDSDACLDWSTTTACTGGQACQGDHCAGCMYGSWMTETVTSVNDMSPMAFAVDGGGNANVSFVDVHHQSGYVDYHALYHYGRPAGGSWGLLDSRGTGNGADPEYNYGTDNHLAVGGDGKVYLVYRIYDFVTECEYASITGADTFESIGTSPAGNPGQTNVDGCFGLNADATGRRHALYSESSYNTHGVYYQTWTGTASSTGRTFDGATEGAIFVDSSGGVHIVYVDSALKYAYRASPTSAWIDEVIDVSGSRLALARDPSGAVHVAYLTAAGLRHARRAPMGGWMAATIDTSTHLDGPAIVCDSHGGVHVAYQDTANHDLEYAYQPPGGTFSSTRVASAGDTGYYPSVALDSSDRVHVVFGDSTGHAIRHATRACQ